MLERRLALFSPGGVGGGPFAEGQPGIAELTARLAAHFDLTFYSLAPVARGFHAEGFRLRAGHPARRLPGTNWSRLAGQFLADHARRPYDAVLCLWGYPVGTVGVALARLVRRPAVVMLLGAEAADLPEIDYGHLGRRRARAALFWTCRRAAALVAVSGYQLRALAARGFERRDAEVVPIGADPARFPFLPPRPLVAPLKLLHVANLTEVKDQGTLLQAFARLRAWRPARLRIVGADYLGGALARLIRELGVGEDVELTGAVPFAQIPVHHGWADMFVLTSLSEGQNRGLTEAALSGLLQVSTPVGHIADLGEAAAVVVHPRDPEDVATKIQAIVADRAAWARKVDAARAWAVAHDLDWTVGRLTEILSSVMRTAHR